MGFCFYQIKKMFHAKRKVASSAETHHEKMQHHCDYTKNGERKKKEAIPSFCQSKIAT